MQRWAQTIITLIGLVFAAGIAYAKLTVVETQGAKSAEKIEVLTQQVSDVKTKQAVTENTVGNMKEQLNRIENAVVPSPRSTSDGRSSGSTIGTYQRSFDK